jgi:hypothetical protein
MTTFKAALKADWAPAIESTARFVGMFIACVIVAADWLRFTWQHPWAGLRALEFPAAASSPRSAPVAPLAIEISPALDAALDQAIGLTRPARPVGLDGLVLAPESIAPAPAPRKRGRRATRQPKVA